MAALGLDDLRPLAELSWLAHNRGLALSVTGGRLVLTVPIVIHHTVFASQATFQHRLPR
jgi:hypothetical protein